jgi:hypothetical protein
LFEEFTEDDRTSALALMNRRNEELHTGANAFADYPPGRWLAGFYRTCGDLCTAMGETLDSLFGEEEANAVRETLVENENDVKQRVNSEIAAYARVFEGKALPERKAAKTQAEAAGAELAKQRHHRVVCPACKCAATVQGTPFGKEIINHNDHQIIVRQAVNPTSFACSACGLRLSGYAELSVAGVGSQYMRTTTTTPEAFYGLYSEDDLNEELESRFPAALEEYMAEQMQEYDNEA